MPPRLRVAQLTHKWPNNLFAVNDLKKIYDAGSGKISGKWSSVGSCEFANISVESDRVDLALNLRKSAESKVEVVKLSLPVNPIDESCFKGNGLDKSTGFTFSVLNDKVLGFTSGVVNLCMPMERKNVPGQKFSVGDKNRIISFRFNGLTLAAIQLSNTVIVQYAENPFSMNQVGTDEGENYMCGLQTSYWY